MRDVDDMKDLKREYLALVRRYGEDAAEYKRFRQSLLDLNRRHRREAIEMYVKIITKVQKKMGPGGA